ncbi:hypothetical protein ASG43_17665 [Aureimonas sp. Leaf454]|nr:hypothetical protein ASG43_17665 [Aureimonas sp. Leaf454]
MFLASGPNLGFLYNDAYAPILGAKHPQALGRPFKEIWSEIWDDIAPLIDKALSGEATWAEDLPLLMHRHGYAEATFFTFSYSPAFDDQGQVVGVFCTCTETTDRVLADRRLEAERHRQRRMLQQMPGFVGMLSGPDLIYEYVNDAYVQISERTDFIGRRFRDVFADIEGQGYFEAFETVYRTGQGMVIRGMELRLHGRTETQVIDFVLEPIRDEESAVIGVFVGGYETTEAYQRGVALQESTGHLRLLVNELNHRVKNSLATVQAIAAQTFKTAETFEQSKKDFSGRLVSLAQAHDVLTETNWSGASIREIVDRTVGPHGDGSGDRFKLDGPDVVLSPKSALAMSMALHELGTNAVKYGSLSVESGHVEITWRVIPSQQGLMLTVVWREVGGPVVTAPTRRGFGSRLIERGLAPELGGEVRIVYDPTGVVCTIDAPLNKGV